MPIKSVIFAAAKAAKAAKTKAEPFPRLFDPKHDTPLNDECLQIYADRARGQPGVDVEAKQLLCMIMELRWHRSRK